MAPRRVVPAYPFEGALFWFLGNRQPHSQEHPYYRVLYGAEPGSLASRSAAIAALYPEIELAPADAGLPDLLLRLTDKLYRHDSLGITCNWVDTEWSPENQAVATAAMKDRRLRALLSTNTALGGDKLLHMHFLCRASLQIRLAARTGATLLGNSFFREVCSFVVPRIGAVLGTSVSESAQAHKIALDPATLSVVGLDFAPANLDAFAAIRESREIAKYATAFRSAIEEAAGHGELEQRLLDAMAQAMDSHDIASRAARAFQTSGTVLTGLGLIPVLGTLASAGGAGAEVGGRAAAALATRNDWYMLGPKLTEVAIRDALARHRRS